MPGLKIGIILDLPVAVEGSSYLHFTGQEPGVQEGSGTRLRACVRSRSASLALPESILPLFTMLSLPENTNNASTCR